VLAWPRPSSRLALSCPNRPFLTFAATSVPNLATTPGADEPDEHSRRCSPTADGAAGGHHRTERSSAYLRLLLALLLPASLFNSYDAQLRGLLLAEVRASLHVGVAGIGLASIPIGAGQFVAFFVVLRADRTGRRPVLLWSVLGYTLFTSLTAASWDLWSFVAFQFAAQVFIGSEFGVAVTLLAEEVPPAARGRALSALLMFSPAGAVVAGALLAAGLLHNPLGWRAFFLLAAVPLLIVAAGRRGLHESRAFVARAPSPGSAGGSCRLARRQLGELWRAPQRARLMAVSAIAFFQGLPAAAAAGWWTYYAENQRHLRPSTAGTFFAIAAALSILGYLVCGWSMDRLGRRPVAIAYVLGAVLCGVVAFQASYEPLMLTALVGTAFFGVGIAPALSAFATELFPTEARAQASGWIRNGFGNLGSISGPALAGVLGAAKGPVGNIGDAVSLLTLAALPITFIVWRYVPETRGALLDGVARLSEPT
jgi:putative MFS transporter